MEPVDREMTLRDYWGVIVRRRWIIAVSVIVAGGLALLLAQSQTPMYSSSAQLVVQPRQAGGLFQGGGNLVLGERGLQTEVAVIQGQVVRSRAGELLGLDRPAPPVSASARPNSDVVVIRAVSTDPATAQNVANAHADAYIEIRREQAVEELLAAGSEVQNKINELQAQIDGLTVGDPLRTALAAQQATFAQTLNQLQVDAALRTGGAAVLSRAPLPGVPFEPTPSRTAVLAAVVGLLIGLGAAFLADYLDDVVRGEEDVEGAVPVPVLAVVPTDPPPDNRPISLSRPEDYAVETYRGLRTNLQFLGLDREIRSVLVTSSLAGEGKTTTATNLAVVLTQAGKRVAILDGDLRKPRLHEVFAVTPTPGITDLILGESFHFVVQPLELDEHSVLDLVPAGDVPANPGELLSGQRFRDVLDEVERLYDYVIVDSAPVLPVADSLALATAVDAVLLVTQAERTSTKNLMESVERLGRVGAPLIGVVLNRASTSRRGGYGYGYGYGTSTGKASSVPSTPAKGRVAKSAVTTSSAAAPSAAAPKTTTGEPASSPPSSAPPARPARGSGDATAATERGTSGTVRAEESSDDPWV